MSKSRISIERKRRIENIKAGKNEVLESKREEHDQVKEKSEVIDKSI